jgi:hypoxanthine phosphoribosyltransferase
LVTWIVTAVGTVASVIALYEFAERNRRRAISWKRIDRLVVELISELHRRAFTPDLILGVGRGGTIVAAMIATNLEGRVPLACVDTAEEHDKSGRKQVQLRDPERLPNVTGRQVLVVVAELYSGQDMRAALDYLETRDVAQLRTLAILCGPASVVRPDFVGFHTKHEPRAPWRLTEAGARGRI